MKILFVGDVFLGQMFTVQASVRLHFQTADYVVCNFENVLAGDFPAREDKASCLTCTPMTLENFFAYVPKDKAIFSLANNHINDLGDAGFLNTKNYLSEHRIAHFGGGFKQDAAGPLIIERSDLKVGLVAFSTNDFEVNAKLATNDHVGTVKISEENIRGMLQALRDRVDHIVVIFHWGREFVPYPSVAERRMAHYAIDWGADLIISHHPHVLRGRETYNGKSIYYSLGNFVFPNICYANGNWLEWASENNHSIGVLVEISSQGIRTSESGFYFDTASLILQPSPGALELFNRYSLPLQSMGLKAYYAYHERQYISIIGKKYRWSRIKALLTKNRNHNRIVGALRRVIHKFRRIGLVSNE